MIVGIAKEIKSHEYRVGLTPHGVKELVRDGHRVLVENEAGVGSGYSDEQYITAGGEIADRERLFGETELLIKIKEPLPAEFAHLRRGLMLFTYLHLAPNRILTEQLIERGVTAFAYETLEKDGEYPLLTPMSEIAGRMAPLIGSYYLQHFLGGNGILPSGIAGVRPARILIIGAGTVGRNAVCTSVGLGMETIVLNRGRERLRLLEREFHSRIRSGILRDEILLEELARTDIVIGGLYARGGRTPTIIERRHLAVMQQGAVLVDVAIDQGGIAATSHPTTHDDPVFAVDGIIHYCVANMPGAYPRTSTLTLTDATLPYIRLLAKLGADEAVRQSPQLGSALNILHGKIIHPVLAEAMAK